MARQEFAKPIRVAVVKRATVNSIVYCEECRLPAKKWDFDHRNPDGLTGKPTLENCTLLCKACHGEKTKADVANIARAKRQEAAHLGVRKAPTLQAPARAPAAPQNKATRPSPKLDALRALGRPNIYRSVQS